MASTFSPLIRVELIGTGDQAGSWGVTTDSNFLNVFEAAIAGTANIAVTAADYTLSTANNAADEARNMAIRTSGVLTGNRAVIVPASSKLYLVYNGNSGAFTLTVKTAAGTGVVIPQGQYVLLYCDGTNVNSAALPTATYADATGAADVITATYNNVSATLIDGYPLSIGIVTPNATTTPTFAPTIGGVLQTARTMVKFVGNAEVALVIGDLQGVIDLHYDLPNLKWVVQNPALANATVLSATTAVNLAGTPALPNGTTATTQAAADNSTKLATTAYADAAVAAGAFTGDVRETFRTTAPNAAWYLVPNAAQAAVARVGTYAGINALMATLGYPFGAGDTTTTFVMPWIPTGYTWVQAVSAATAGALTHGKVKDHVHKVNQVFASTFAAGASSAPQLTFSDTLNPTAPEGGPDNLAAALGINYILKL